MASIDAVRLGLQARLATISGLNAYENWPDTFLGPGAIILPASPNAADQTLGESTLQVHTFEILAAVAMAAPFRTIQSQLDGYTSNTGTSSIRAAIVADRTLGGVAITTYFDAWSEPDDEPINGINHLGQRLMLRVWTA